MGGGLKQNVVWLVWRSLRCRATPHDKCQATPTTPEWFLLVDSDDADQDVRYYRHGQSGYSTQGKSALRCIPNQYENKICQKSS